MLAWLTRPESVGVRNMGWNVPSLVLIASWQGYSSRQENCRKARLKTHVSLHHIQKYLMTRASNGHQPADAALCRLLTKLTKERHKCCSSLHSIICSAVVFPRSNNFLSTTPYRQLGKTTKHSGFLWNCGHSSSRVCKVAEPRSTQLAPGGCCHLGRKLWPNTRGINMHRTCAAVANPFWRQFLALFAKHFEPRNPWFPKQTPTTWSMTMLFHAATSLCPGRECNTVKRQTGNQLKKEIGLELMVSQAALPTKNLKV